MVRRNLNEKQPAKNIAVTPPTRPVGRDEAGIPIVEKVNPIPLHMKMVNPAGMLVQVSLASGFTIRGGRKQHWRDNPYGAQKWQEKIEQGFLPYALCPLKHDWVPARDKNDKPCGGEFSEQKCCPHIERIIEMRKEKQRRHSEEYARHFQSNEDRMVEAMRDAVHQIAARPDKRNVPR